METDTETQTARKINTLREGDTDTDAHTHREIHTH